MFGHPPSVSPGDYNQMMKRDDPSYPLYVGPIYHYVIDLQTPYIMKPSQLPQAANKLEANHPAWRTGQCAWPKRRYETLFRRHHWPAASCILGDSYLHSCVAGNKGLCANRWTVC